MTASLKFACPACGFERVNAEAECQACNWKPQTKRKVLKAEQPRAAAGRRRSYRPILGLIAVTCLIAGGLFSWWKNRSVGAKCSVDSDCFSRACLVISGGVMFKHVGVCTKSCRSNADCPTDMHCSIGVRGRNQQTPPSLLKGERRVCSPTGERLKRLLK